MVSIASIIILGLGAVSAFFFFRRAAETSLPQAAAETGSAFGSIGTGLGGFGGGIAALGQGIGAGITGLFSPLSFFKNLFPSNTPPTIAPSPDTVSNVPESNFGFLRGFDDSLIPSGNITLAKAPDQFVAQQTRLLTGSVLGGVPVTVNTSGLSPGTISALGL